MRELFFKISYQILRVERGLQSIALADSVFRFAKFFPVSMMMKSDNFTDGGNDVDGKMSILRKMWPSEVVARDLVKEFSGGMITPRTLANLDSQGKGPANRFLSGKKVCYFIDDLIEWLETRYKDLSEN